MSKDDKQKLIRDFYFEAKAQGWAANAEPDTDPRFPGYKLLNFVWDYFRLLDMWCTSPTSPYSTGTTTVWLENKVVMTVQYSGWYEKSAIPFVKQALSRAYTQKLWSGGRGPTLFTSEEHPGLVYVNEFTEQKGNVYGKEMVLDNSLGSVVKGGEHRYTVQMFLNS